jgi:predicted NACHT family NTPase
VLQQIRDFSQQFPQNQFVITCRIAAWEYTFEQFTEVEIADFNDKQIADFSGKWFRSKNDPIKAERFLQKLKEDEPIQELATSPLLLTLLCLVFEDSGSFPINHAELYQTGVDVLLKKWDVKRNIERDQAYKRLSLKRKEDLLSQIAYTTFEAGNYFFKQREVERYITQYIQNLPDASTDPETLELDSATVLKSIEAQHGLLVERARAIYSFSHLTFHEYFTARKIVTSVGAKGHSPLQELVNHLTEKRWREVFLLTIGMLDSADALLQLMKAQTDWLLAGNEKLQQFLKWVDEKARAVEVSYKLAAIRAFYFTLVLAQDLTRSFAQVLAPALTSTLDIAIIEEPELLLNFKELRNQLPDSSRKNRENFQQWWQANGQAWTEQLRAEMIEYHNIGHDWQFSDAQKEQLQQYYDANKLLVDCLNSDCYVSRKVRQEIEETLLLPIAEIEKRKQLNQWRK